MCVSESLQVLRHGDEVRKSQRDVRDILIIRSFALTLKQQTVTLKVSLASAGAANGSDVVRLSVRACRSGFGLLRRRIAEVTQTGSNTQVGYR